MTVSSSSFSPRVPPKALLWLPARVRLQIARVAVWRMRRAEALKTTMLGVCLVMVSAVLGLLLTQSLPAQNLSRDPQLLRALPVLDQDQSPDQARIDAQQWGELQAEVLRLRLLFSHIAEASALDAGEFSSVVQLEDERYLNALAALDATPQTTPDRFMLAKRAVDHMTTDAQLMLSISQQRRQARRFTLSGSPVVSARMTSGYGYRKDPRSGRIRFHRGVDFGGLNGSKVFALADGIVTYSGTNGGYGNLVELEHVDGYRTHYAHNEANLVNVGSSVNKGEVIATMGSTGNSTGTHIHIEVRAAGQAVDPMQFISEGS